MTVIIEPYIPVCAATIDIVLPPNNTLQTPPRKVNFLHVLLYACHPLVLVVGFVPVILLGWLGFIFLQYPATFGQFVYFSYLVLPFLVQLICAVVRGGRAHYYMKYAAHGIAKMKNDPLGIEVMDAITQTKVLDLGLRALQYVPSESEEPIVLFNSSDPTKYLSLIPYRTTFYVRFDSIRVRFSMQVILSIFTFCALCIELIVVLSAPAWSGIKMLP